MDTSTILGLIAGALLAALFEYAPGFAGWYDKFEQATKRLIMLLLVTGAALAAFGIGCIPDAPVSLVECSQAGVWELAGLWVVTITANQGTHRGIKKAG